MRPFEHRHRPIERLLNVGARPLLGGETIGLLRRTELDRPDREQPRAVAAEELLCVLVGVDEAAGVDVEHHDDLGCMIDQQPVARRTLAHRLLRLAPLGDVAQTQHEHLAPRKRGFADRDFGREAVAALTLREQLARPQIERRIPRGGGKPLQRLRDGLAVIGQLRNEQVDPLADDLGFRVAEDALAGRIEGADHPLLVHAQHHVLDVIENDLQMLGALLARLERECPRFICHEAHGFHDPAPLVLEREVVVVDQPQQQADVRLSAAGPQLQLAQLRPQVRVQIGIFLRERPRIRPDERRGGSRAGFRPARARP